MWCMETTLKNSNIYSWDNLQTSSKFQIDVITRIEWEKKGKRHEQGEEGKAFQEFHFKGAASYMIVGKANKPIRLKRSSSMWHKMGIIRGILKWRWRKCKKEKKKSGKWMKVFFSNFECMCKIFYGLSENHETVCFVKNMLINHLVKSVCLEMYTRKGNTKKRNTWHLLLKPLFGNGNDNGSEA